MFRITCGVAKVEGTNLTVTARGDKGERTETFTTGTETKVLIETAEDEKVKVKGEGANGK